MIALRGRLFSPCTGSVFTNCVFMWPQEAPAPYLGMPACQVDGDPAEVSQTHTGVQWGKGGGRRCDVTNSEFSNWSF